MEFKATDRTQCLKRIGSLKLERSTWFDHWQTINRVLLPRTGQFFVTDTNKGNRRNDDIVDNTATMALTTIGAGMVSGLTNPAQPWVRMETANEELMESAAVSRWCDKVSQLMLMIFARSNTYRMLHQMYTETAAYGTAASIVLPDFENVIHSYPMTIGEFAISADDRGIVNTLSRELEMNVGQIVKRFVSKGYLRDESKWDWSNASAQVKNLYDAGQFDAWIPLYQLIEPREFRDVTKKDNKNMPFASVTFEQGGDGNKLLHESGYKRFPVFTTRWYTRGQDIYGSDCPGMVALGDILQLQSEQLSKMRGIDYMSDPPIQVPYSLKNQDSDFLPGGVTYVPGAGQAKVESAFNVQLNLNHLSLDIQDVRNRINKAFFADLFLFLSQIEASRGQRTAREIAEIHEEKLLQLGPVVERFEEDLRQLVDITFDAASDAGILPEPPPELTENGEGAELSIKFNSMFTQAQRSVSMSGVDRIVGAIASISAAKQDPSVWDKLNTDRTIDKAALYLSVDSELINSEEEVNALRDQRAQQQAAMQKAAMAKEASETAQNLGNTPMGGDTALSAIAQSAPAFTGI